MRDSHRAEAEGLLRRAVEEEVRRSGGRTDGNVLLSRARAALDAMAGTAGEEYSAYTHALDEAAAGQLTFRQRYAREGAGTPLLVAAVAAVAAVVADVALGTGTGTAVGAGVTVGVVGAAATVVKVVGAHVPAAHHRAGAVSQPGGPEQLRLQWLTALEVRGIRPFLDQQRMLAASTGPAKTGPKLRGADKSAAARGRSALEQSFGQLPEPEGAFAGRRAEMARLRQWVQAARASTETKPTVVVLHGAPGSGRTTLAVRAVHELRDYFRGACLVDLRGAGSAAGGSTAGGSTAGGGGSGGPGPAGSVEGGESPLSTRDALLHLLNRLGAPREQLLFRERSSADQQVKRLSELYHQHLTGVPVTVVLDDASDPEQVRTLVPERSDSLVLVTARQALRLPPDLPARVYDLPVEALDAAGAEELLGAAAEDASGPYDAESSEQIRQLCGGLPLALRIAGSSLGPRSPRALATDLAAYGPVEPVERALWLRYTDQSELGPAAAAPAGAGRAHLAGCRRRGRAAGHGRDGGDPAARGAVAGGTDRPRPGQPLPPARRGARLRPRPPRRRGGARRADGRTGTAHRQLRRAGRLRTAAGRRQHVDPLQPVRAVRLHVPGRGAALAGRRVELHHGGAQARGGRRPGHGAEPAGRAVRLLPAARRPLPAGRDQRAGAVRGPGAAGALGAVAHRYRGPAAR
ncbi:NB-ARC domain-containing protein [Streptomyces rubrogriseus]|uniref:NB-ARC domain-containing protein n=1 Tax=Streptomyces rubrogriseus TaxID=194673 RepID=UPI003569E12F